MCSKWKRSVIVRVESWFEFYLCFFFKNKISLNSLINYIGKIDRSVKIIIQGMKSRSRLRADKVDDQLKLEIKEWMLETICN